MTLLVLLLHGLGAFLLLGAITHQALVVWAPIEGPRNGWWDSLRGVRADRYVLPVVILFTATALLGAIDYLPFRMTTRATFLDTHAPWATGLFEIKEHAIAIALALLPAYWSVWRDPAAAEGGRRGITTLLALCGWWSFFVGHIVNNVRGLG